MPRNQSAGVPSPSPLSSSRGVLRRQPALGLIERLGMIGGGQKRFQQRCLAVLVEVGQGLGNRFGQVSAEARVVLLEAALRRSDDHASGGRQRLEKGGARRRGIDQDNRSLHGPEPFGQVVRRQVGPSQIEPRGPSVECPVSDQDQPEGGVTGV